MNPIIAVLFTTYSAKDERTEEALETIRSLKQNLIYDQVLWWVSDDGSSKEHQLAIRNEIGDSYQVHWFNSERQGVGFGMNHSLRKIWDLGVELVLSLENDWRMERPVDMAPYVKTLMDHPEHGMIRFGYLSPDLLGYIISEENKLYWRLENSGTTYRYAGHPHLKHRRFHDSSLGGYGYFDEGLAPGMTELSMCGLTNRKAGPNILYPAECGAWGFWGHIGKFSQADIIPFGR